MVINHVGAGIEGSLNFEGLWESGPCFLQLLPCFKLIIYYGRVHFDEDPAIIDHVARKASHCRIFDSNFKPLVIRCVETHFFKVFIQDDGLTDSLVHKNDSLFIEDDFDTPESQSFLLENILVSILDGEQAMQILVVIQPFTKLLAVQVLLCQNWLCQIFIMLDVCVPDLERWHVFGNV
jgi:hypothetical protein